MKRSFFPARPGKKTIVLVTYKSIVLSLKKEKKKENSVPKTAVVMYAE